MFGYSLGQSISALYVQAKPYGTSSGSLRVYVPSLMSGITKGTPKVTPVSLNKACFNNASDCKPSVASKINTQNYITAKAPSTPYEHPLYRFQTELRIHAETSDCLTCRLHSEDLDNSFRL